MSKLNDDKKKYFQQKFVDRYVAERKNNNWENYRNKQGNRFKLEEIDIPCLGKKLVYVETQEDTQYNLNLQESRGIGISENSDIDGITQNIANEVNVIKQSEQLRISEFYNFIQSDSSLDINKLNFLEIGFRVPTIQNFFKNKLGCKTAMGIDINNFNVELCKALGYDVEVYNLMSDMSIKETLNRDFDLISCYHVLEHVQKPFKALNNIYDSLKKGGLLHIEVPIEPGVPRLQYGHLISFDPKDMFKLLNGVGFTVLSGTNQTHDGGPWIERYIAKK